MFFCTMNLVVPKLSLVSKKLNTEASGHCMFYIVTENEKKPKTLCEESLKGYVHARILVKMREVFLRSILQLAPIL